MTDRWLIVCDCAGHPEELVGVVDLDENGATVRYTGRGSGLPSLRGANRIILATPPGDRSELIRRFKSRDARLPATVPFSHGPCEKSLWVNEQGLAELFGAVSKVVTEQRVSLSLLCAVNGKLPRGMTR